MSEQVCAELSGGEGELSAIAHVQQGDRLFHQKQWDAAAAAYGRAIELEPGRVPVLCKLGRVCLRLEDWAGAERWFGLALAVNGGSHLASYGMAEVLMEREDWVGAVEQLRRVVALGPGFVGVVYLDLGGVLGRLGRWDEAISAYCAALRSSSELDRVYESLGAVLYEQTKILGSSMQS